MEWFIKYKYSLVQSTFTRFIIIFCVLKHVVKTLCANFIEIFYLISSINEFVISTWYDWNTGHAKWIHVNKKFQIRWPIRINMVIWMLWPVLYIECSQPFLSIYVCKMTFWRYYWIYLPLLRMFSTQQTVGKSTIHFC